MPINHVRTWQIQPNLVRGNTTTALDGDRYDMAGVLTAFLGQGVWYDKDANIVAPSGNWTITSACDGSGGAGSFGNNDNVNRFDLAGSIDRTKLVWANAGTNHSWAVLQQTGIAPKYQVCLDLNSASTFNASIIVSFGAGFGLANGGADGTATARPTATDEQVLISTNNWGGGSTVGSVWSCAKSADGKAFRFWRFRGGSCIQWLMFEVPDPVVSAWTSPSIAHALGHQTTTESLTWSRLGGANTYSRTPGGTTFTSAFCAQASQSDGSTPLNQGILNDVDLTRTFRQIALQSTTVNARGLNGMIVDAYWGDASEASIIGQESGGVAPAGATQWTRVGALWMPWITHNAFNPRVEL